MHGVSGSGKSWISNYMANIFQSYKYAPSKETFDEKLGVEDAHRQLLIIDEANMEDLHTKKNLTRVKKLTEGFGYPFSNKYGHPFTGFIDSYQIITC